MWKCDLTGSKVRGTIRVDGSDACDCISCRRFGLLNGSIGAIDAAKETLNLALQYMTVWNDPKEALRLVRLVRDNMSERQHELRQVTGDRSLIDDYVPDPDDAEVDSVTSLATV